MGRINFWTKVEVILAIKECIEEVSVGRAFIILGGRSGAD